MQRKEIANVSPNKMLPWSAAQNQSIPGRTRHTKNATIWHRIAQPKKKQPRAEPKQSNPQIQAMYRGLLPLRHQAGQETALAEQNLGGARRGGRWDGAVRGEQEASVDEEPVSAFPSSSSFSAAGEGHGRDGGALGGEQRGLDPLQLGPAAGAEAPPRAVAQDPHPTPPLSLLPPASGSRRTGAGRRCPRATGGWLAPLVLWLRVPRGRGGVAQNVTQCSRVPSWDT